MGRVAALAGIPALAARLTKYTPALVGLSPAMLPSPCTLFLADFFVCATGHGRELQLSKVIPLIALYSECRHQDNKTVEFLFQNGGGKLLDRVRVTKAIGTSVLVESVVEF